MEGGTRDLWWRRAAARAVDAAVLSPVVLWVVWKLVTLPPMGLEGIGVVLGLFLLAVLWMTFGWAAYDAWALARWGATVGKRLAGIEVRALDGSLPTRRQALRRSMYSIVLAVLAGVVLSAATSGASLFLFPALPLWWLVQTAQADGRTSYDRAAGTVVRRRDLSLPPAEDAAAAAAPLWWVWSRAQARRQAAVVVLACTALMAVSLVGGLRGSHNTMSERLAGELATLGFHARAEGTRSAHCYSSWPAAECRAADDGPDLRRDGTLDDAVADVRAGALAVGLRVDDLADFSGDSGPHAGEQMLVVRSRQRMLLVFVRDHRARGSLLPQGQVAVFWKGPRGAGTP